jgi:PAS domain S-box-containing protein
MQEGFVLHDSTGAILLTNPSAENILGLTADQMRGRTSHDPIWQATHEDGSEFPGETHPAMISLREGIVQNNVIMRIRKPSDEQTLISINSAPLFQDGKIAGALAIFTDITERKRLEEQFLQAQKMESVGQMAGGIAHNFNNILMIILGYAELTDAELPDNSHLHHNLRNILDASNRASILVRQLLSFARRQMIAPQIISPNAHIQSMMQMLQPLIGADILLETDLDPLAGQIRIDPNQLEQAVVNLVLNARDAMPQGGTLVLQTAGEVVQEGQPHPQFALPPGSYVRLSVTDTGKGMSDSVKMHLFEPFFTTKEQGKGTGLGLASVYGIVRQNLGHIFVESAVGEGSTFHIYLPKVETASAYVEGEASESTETVRGSQKVLVVEDEPLIRQLMTFTLRQKGYWVLEAENGKEALRVAERHGGEIHLLLTDAIMPEMGGKELSEIFQQRYPATRIMIASGHSEVSVKEEHAFLDSFTFLQKPFTPGKLLAKVNEVLM